MQKMLGKLPYRYDERTLKFVNYLPYTLPKIPPVARWDRVKGLSDWGIDGNDRYGNCVIATAAHIIDCAKANESEDLNRIEDMQVVSLSRQMNALQGYTIIDRLKWWKNQGMFDSKIDAFVYMDVNHDLIRSAINIFGHADIGLQMPTAWENCDVWDVGTGRAFEVGGWGGHSVPILGYETKGGTIFYYACTWGHITLITREALTVYCDEVWVSILPEWFAADRVTPSGFDSATLQRDLLALA